MDRNYRRARALLPRSILGAVVSALLIPVIMLSLSLISLLVCPTVAVAQPPLPDGFYRYPSIGGGVIVFASEGDL